MKNIKTILIIILFVVILIQSLTKPRISKPEIITKTDTITIIKDSIHYVPKPYLIYKDTGSYHVKIDTFKIPTDTPSIIAAYVQKIVYSDTLLHDSTGFIFVQDTLQYNRIKSRLKRIKIYSYTKTIHTPVKSHFFAGLGLGGNKNQFGVTGNLALQTKQGKLYTVQYDILNKSIFFSLYWKIK